VALNSITCDEERTRGVGCRRFGWSLSAARRASVFGQARAAVLLGGWHGGRAVGLHGIAS
jgi:hypothetical protein